MPANSIAAPLVRGGGIFLLAAFSLTFAASAKAQFHVTAAQRAACTPDALRLCSSEIPDMGRVAACMRANQARLSDRCRAVFQSASANRSQPTANERRPGREVAAVASDRHMAYSRHRGPVYARNHHPSYAGGYEHSFLSHSGWMRSKEAMFAARQIMTGLGWACQTQSVPTEVCSMSSAFMGYFAQ